jgi:signal transduction histidine kinase/ligand-binding sensor domain-containing protein
MKSSVLGAIVISIAILQSDGAHALDPARKLTQYAHTAWRLQDGYLPGGPNAITQTADGYVWIGTLSGLVRFDGVRFVPWTLPTNLRLASPSVFSLLGSRDGSLLIGTGTGLLRLKNNQLIRIGSSQSRIENIEEDAQGRVWIARGRISDKLGPFCRLEGEDLQCYGKSDGVTATSAGVVTSDASGNIWVGSTNMLTRWQANSIRVLQIPALKHSEGLTGINGLAADSTGLWVGFHHSGRGLGLQRYENETWKPFRSGSFDSSSLSITTMFISKSHDVWMGTSKSGIFRIHNQSVDHFGTADGLSSDAIRDIDEDGEGNLWIATSEGVDNLRDLPVTSFSKRQGLTADDIGSVLATPDGTVWIGNDGGLDLLGKNGQSSIRRAQGLPGRKITSLFRDHAGRMWIGIDDGLYLYEGGHFRQISYTDNKPTGIVIALAEDNAGTIWANVRSPAAGLLKIENNKITANFAAPTAPGAFDIAKAQQGGIWISLVDGKLARMQNDRLEYIAQVQDAHIGAIRTLLVDPDGALWGATTSGVIQWYRGNLKILKERNGLPCPTVYALARDQYHNLWLNTACGFVKIDSAQLEHWLALPNAKIPVETFDAFDGAQPAATSFRPAAATAAGGQLWFANDSLLQMIDPGKLHRNTIVPPIHIEELVADGNVVPLSSDLRLAPLTRDIELDYTALSFVEPQRVRFRYRLEGHDDHWQEVGTRREAFYTNLAPGVYQFRVTACNNSGVWNEQGAVLAFRIRAAWYQTLWFKIVCLILTFLAAYIFYRSRVEKRVATLQLRFDERMKERTRLAHDLHDTLMQTIQMSRLIAEHAQDNLTNTQEAEKSLNRLTAWLERATEEGRAAVTSLSFSKGSHSDMAESFRSATQDCRVTFPIEMTVHVLGKPRDIHPAVSEEIYRIGYEALINACAHAHAKNVRIEFEYDRNFTLRVRDDGCGIDAEILRTGKAGHLGLAGMRERAGRIGGNFFVDSSKSVGTEIVLYVPGQIAYRRSRLE